MPFKRSNSRYYWMGPLRAGTVHIPRMSTGQTTKVLATAVENAMRELAATGYADLVQRVADGELSPPDLYAAKLNGKDALLALRNQQEDPPLAEVVLGTPTPDRDEHGEPIREGGFRDELTDERHQDGMDILLALAPKDARFSWIRDPTNLNGLYRRALRGEDEKGKARRRGEGRRPHTVRRSLHQSIAALLKDRLGRGAMLAIMAEVDVPGGNDERTVMLSQKEIDAVLSASDPEFRPLVALTLTTGIDRTPLQAALVGDYDDEQGTLTVRDTKTSARPRMLILREEPVLENAEPWLRELIAGKEAGEAICSLTNRQIQKRWEAVREQVGRSDVRWKDLRGIFATYYLQAGGDPRILQDVLGHATMTMTLRYLKRLPIGSRRHVSESAKTMGLPAPRLTVEKGGAA